MLFYPFFSKNYVKSTRFCIIVLCKLISRFFFYFHAFFNTALCKYKKHNFREIIPLFPSFFSGANGFGWKQMRFTHQKRRYEPSQRTGKTLRNSFHRNFSQNENGGRWRILHPCQRNSQGRKWCFIFTKKKSSPFFGSFGKLNSLHIDVKQSWKEEKINWLFAFERHF